MIYVGLSQAREWAATGSIVGTTASGWTSPTQPIRLNIINVGRSRFACALTSGRLFGYLARRPGNSATTARCPGEERACASVPVVGARGRRRRNGEHVDEPEVSATDAAVRQRIHKLGIHIPCGQIRGPVPARILCPLLWQSCRCEDHPLKWWGAEVSRDKDRCIICFRATVGGQRDGRGSPAKTAAKPQQFQAPTFMSVLCAWPAWPLERHRRSWPCATGGRRPATTPA